MIRKFFYDLALALEELRVTRRITLYAVGYVCLDAIAQGAIAWANGSMTAGTFTAGVGALGTLMTAVYGFYNYGYKFNGLDKDSG